MSRNKDVRKDPVACLEYLLLNNNYQAHVHHDNISIIDIRREKPDKHIKKLYVEELRTDFTQMHNDVTQVFVSKLIGDTPYYISIVQASTQSNVTSVTLEIGGKFIKIPAWAIWSAMAHPNFEIGVIEAIGNTEKVSTSIVDAICGFEPLFKSLANKCYKYYSGNVFFISPSKRVSGILKAAHNAIILRSNCVNHFDIKVPVIHHGYDYSKLSPYITTGFNTYSGSGFNTYSGSTTITGGGYVTGTTTTTNTSFSWDNFKGLIKKHLP